MIFPYNIPNYKYNWKLSQLKNLDKRTKVVEYIVNNKTTSILFKCTNEGGFLTLKLSESYLERDRSSQVTRYS